MKIITNKKDIWFQDSFIINFADFFDKKKKLKKFNYDTNLAMIWLCYDNVAMIRMRYDNVAMIRIRAVWIGICYVYIKKGSKGQLFIYWQKRL